jgi:hypothetical protein
LIEKNIKHIDVEEKLFSRKNNVYKIELDFGNNKSTYILKEYAGRDRYIKIKKELFFYDILKESDLKIPGIFFKGDAVLVMDFISDETLLDYIIKKEDSENSKKPACYSPGTFINDYEPVIKACKYMDDFNRFLKSRTGRSFILNDINLRNFLLFGKKLYRVDFEDCREGEIEEDIGKFIAFFLTYGPAFTEWKRSVSVFIKDFCKNSMGVDIARVDMEIHMEFKRMRERRKGFPTSF